MVEFCQEKWETIQHITHCLSNSQHLHGDTLHQIKTMACHCDGPATTVKQITIPHAHTDRHTHTSGQRVTSQQ